MWKPRSDIGKLQYRDVNFNQDDQGLLQGVILTARSPKEIEAKSSKLGALKDKEVCPIYTLWQFCQRTKHLQTHLAEDHLLFLASTMDVNSKKIYPMIPSYHCILGEGQPKRSKKKHQYIQSSHSKIGSKYESFIQ